MSIDFDKEIKVCLLQKDIMGLQVAQMDMKKRILEAKKVIFEAEGRAKEYADSLAAKQAELATIE